MKNGKGREQHLALCANIEKDVENFSAESRAASIVTSYIEKWNAVEQDVDRDSVERSFSISIDKVCLNVLTEISGAMHAINFKKGYGYGWCGPYTVCRFLFDRWRHCWFCFFFLNFASLKIFAFSHFLSSWTQLTRMVGGPGPIRASRRQPAPLVI